MKNLVDEIWYKKKTEKCFQAYEKCFNIDF